MVSYRKNAWAADATPSWDEKLDYRLHPHNDLIKARKNGAKIESYICGEWIEEPAIDWYEDTQYRIKPTTKTVYEWMYKDGDGDWVISKTLYTDEQLALTFKSSVTKTGRSWETEV